MKLIYKYILFIFLIALMGCIEEIPLDTQTSFDEVLVVEANITNEFKTQSIQLSKSYRLEANGPNPTSDAIVTIFDNLGNSYHFIETESGVYNSISEFAAQANTKYTLEIIEENTTYTSTQESFKQPTQIDQLYLERGVNENNEEGISIFIDSFDPTGESKHYRHEYEESYKIIAPRYSPLKLVDLEAFVAVPLGQFANIQEIQGYFVELVTRDQQVQICYNTLASNTIIITNTNNLNEDRLKQYRVRFISRDNYIISHRYSILVKQYVQSPEAYNYYNVLNNFSTSESVFSGNQTGFLQGNITATSNSDIKKVVGYFEVNPTDSKRLYFNYADEFPNEDLPPYYAPCTSDIYPSLFRADPLPPHIIIESDLVDSLRDGYQYISANSADNIDFPPPLHPFIMVQEPCGDCTALGSTTVPDFWEE